MRNWLFTASVMGALAVLCGAFADHGLSGRLGANALPVFKTGVRYHMCHALAMALAAFAMRGPAMPQARTAAMLFLGGILLFSGSLYLLALTDANVPAFITPVGGLAFLAGWIFLGLAAVEEAQS